MGSPNGASARNVLLKAARLRISATPEIQARESNQSAVLSELSSVGFRLLAVANGAQGK
jgi:hypothetical protein